MTLFRDVFQRHLAQKEGAASDPDAAVPQAAQTRDAPPASMPVPSLEPPTPQTHGMLPTGSGASTAAEPSATQSPPEAQPEPSHPPSAAPRPLPDTLDPQLVARAAKAHRLIAENQALRDASPAPAERAADGAADARPSRVRTRLLSFGDTGSAYVDPLSELGESPPQRQFPCGWLVVIKGHGRGASFALHPGIAQIGRGEDQAISLDFGDRAISRERHAVVAYDPELKKFFLAHGGKSNIIRLNDRPVLSTEEMTHGSTITIGETVLRLAAFCDETFHWSEGEN